MANNDSHGSPRDITRLIVGLLLGSGISGLAIGMIQGDPGVRPWGMAVFVLCLIASGALFWFGETVIERKERESKDLKRLGTAYSNIIDGIALEVEGFAEIPEAVQPTIANILRKEVDKSLLEDVKADWVKVFRERIQDIIDRWEKRGREPSKAGIVQPDAIPETQS